MSIATAIAVERLVDEPPLGLRLAVRDYVQAARTALVLDYPSLGNARETYELIWYAVRLKTADGWYGLLRVECMTEVVRLDMLMG